MMDDQLDMFAAMPEGKAVFVKANNVIYLNWPLDELEQALEDGLAAFVESRRRASAPCAGVGTAASGLRGPLLGGGGIGSRRVCQI
jgi:hypothetical protein